MMISYWTMNGILIDANISTMITKQEVQKRWGMVKFESHQPTFEYDVEFASEQHEMLFLLEFGHLL